MEDVQYISPQQCKKKHRRMKGRSPSLPRIYTQHSLSSLFFSIIRDPFVSFGYCHIEDKVGICTRRARHTCITVPSLRAHCMDANNGQWNSLPRERLFLKKVASVVGSMTNLISLISQSAIPRACSDHVCWEGVLTLQICGQRCPASSTTTDPYQTRTLLRW